MDWYLSLFRNLWVVGGLIGGVLFVIALSAFGSGLSLEDWRNLVFVLAGLIGLPLALWRSGVAANQVKVATKQVELSEAGQNTDRYQKGASMLGDNRLSVRQAGVFGLTELAENNFDAYHALVMKLLCSFIRDRSLEQQREAADMGDAEPKYGETSLRVAPDCQTALTSLSVLSRIAKMSSCVLPDGALNLNYAVMSGADLKGAHMEGADLLGARMEGAELEGADLKGAHMEGAVLDGAGLRDAHLEGADLARAHLADAHLQFAHLEGADLEGADLEGASLIRAHLEGAVLIRAHLEGALLLGVHLEGALLLDAHLEDAHLHGANLAGAYLKGAHLHGANLDGADLDGAVIDEAIGLTSTQLETAKNYSPELLEKLRKAEKAQEREAD